MKFTLIFGFLCLCSTAYSQLTQTIKGRVIDSDSKIPLHGASISIPELKGKGAVSDEAGFFKIPEVEVGRYHMEVRYLGYDLQIVSNVIVSSGKEVYLPVEMQEQAQGIDAVNVRAINKSGSYNDMATLSSRSFNAEEAERYPGSRQDPARMASNYPGVQGTDDSRNDIVVRGNSPLGVLWRFEGIDIPNPSHFAIAGSTGGPLSILNNKVIGYSDFMSGAFPSEYGNALSGIFDIRMRNGNREKREHTAQIGVLGLELMSEGPINKEKGSSYIASYRYSTFAFFQAINFRLGTEAIPKYQDASFKLNFPGKNNNSFSVWGIGGTSSIDIIFSDDTIPTNDLYGENDRDQYFRTSMFTLGVSHNVYFKNGWSSKLSLAQIGQNLRSTHDFIAWDSTATSQGELLLDSLRKVQGYRMFEGRTALHWALNKKFNARSRLKLGLMADLYRINYLDSSRGEYSGEWVKKLDGQEYTGMIRAYASHKYRINGSLTLNSGIHLLYFEQSAELSVEPRLGLNFKLNDKAAISLGYGLHSRMQPMYSYYNLFSDSLNPQYNKHNENMGLTKSHHLVLAYDRQLGRDLRLKLEAYYQYLYNIPVEQRGGSYSLINEGSGFVRFFPGTLENTGTGENYGLEATLERFFSKNFFFLGSGSIFNSTYKGKDGVKRNTDFNGNFIVNGLGGYEIPVGKDKKNRISFGTKLTWAGGRRYSPVDSAATAQDGIYVHFVDNERNSLQFPDYWRWDIKLGYKINGKNASHEFSLDVLNVTNRENLLTIVYANDPENPGTRRLVSQPQLALLPLFYYKVDF